MIAAGCALLVLSALCQEPALRASFETAEAGSFTEARCALGTLVAIEGHGEIDASHARTGSHCLRLMGGDNRRVVLDLAGGARMVGTLSFWAERWTRRDPFAFSVEVHAEDGWRQVVDGSKTLLVGASFRSEVRLAVDDVIDAVRFTSSSPDGSGVLIDDLEVGRTGPLRLERLEVARPTLPVLVGNRWNPVARLDLDVSGTTGSLVLKRVELALTEGTTSGTVREVALFRGPAALDSHSPMAGFTTEMRVGKAQRAKGRAVDFRPSHDLERGATHLWIAVSLSKDADLDGRVGVECLGADIGEQRVTPHDPGSGMGTDQRLGVALRTKGSDGSQAFRIPGLVTTNEGTLIAVYDVRWKGFGDLPGDIDVGMSRSTDGGRTWEPQRIIMDMGGKGDAASRGDGIGDPSILVDRGTGAIMVLATWSHGNRAWRGSGPGLEPDETGQLMLSVSDDDGRTFSAPRNLTASVKDPSWCYLLQGPGRGITMGDGTLVFPAQYQDTPENGRMPHSTVMWSGDHGETWTIGTGARSNTTEAAVVELQDGALLLNMRDNRGGSRAISTTRDLGASWEEHPTSRRALIEPVCMASLIHVGRELGTGPDGRLIFSNPFVSQGPRRNLSLRVSTDHGNTWRGQGLVLDGGRSAGYSCLTMIDEHTVGVLYEGSRAHLTFQRIPLTSLFPEPRGGAPR